MAMQLITFENYLAIIISIMKFWNSYWEYFKDDFLKIELKYTRAMDVYTS